MIEVTYDGSRTYRQAFEEGLAAAERDAAALRVVEAAVAVIVRAMDSEVAQACEGRLSLRMGRMRVDDARANFGSVWSLRASPGPQETDWTAVAVLSLGRAGYPAQLTYGAAREARTCSDGDELVMHLRAMLATADIGRALVEVMSRAPAERKVSRDK